LINSRPVDGATEFDDFFEKLRKERNAEFNATIHKESEARTIAAELNEKWGKKC